MEGWAGVVLAAGHGTRMKSALPKVLHKLCGQEMLLYPIQALRDAGVERIVTVVSPESEGRVRELLGESVQYACQSHALGTGHALLHAESLLKGQVHQIVVLGADSPLIRAGTIQALSRLHLDCHAYVTLLSSAHCMQQEMGRVVRDGEGRVLRIVEAEEEDGGAGGQEVNAGAYCFEASWLWDRLHKVPVGKKGEFYLTSLVQIASAEEARVEALPSDDPVEALGVNDRVQMALATAAINQQARERWMLQGVTMVDPASVFIDACVELGQDTVIHPNTMILGVSRVGRECRLGPGSVIRDSRIGDRCTVTASFLEDATLEEGVNIGPFSHLRPGAYLERGVHIGNFSEVKNSRIGRGSAMGHFGYVGDASIGPEVNLGAGTVTCNYDGEKHNHTVIEEGAFIGCDTMLVAPVRVGAHSITGAGSVITKDVPSRRLAVGVPAKIKKTSKKFDK